jgi:hypothetical protein
MNNAISNLISQLMYLGATVQDDEGAELRPNSSLNHVKWLNVSVGAGWARVYVDRKKHTFESFGINPNLNAASAQTFAPSAISGQAGGPVRFLVEFLRNA